MNNLLPKILLYSFLVFAVSNSAEGQESNKRIFDDNNSSVVKITALNSLGDPVSQGSGVVVKAGVILTNAHVVKNSHRVDISIAGKSIQSNEIYISEDYDLATILFPYNGTRIASIAEVPPVVGDEILTIGSPLGLENSLSIGIVSGIRNDLIQISAAISPGSSGGGLFNKYGKLIGITTSKMVGGENLNFAIPVNFYSNTNYFSLAEKNKMESLSPKITFLNNFFAFGMSTEGIFKNVDFISSNGLIVDGTLVYYTSMNRVFSVSEENDKWFEIISRKAINCGMKKMAIIDTKMLNFDNDVVGQESEETLKWIPIHEKQESEFLIICMLLKMSEYDFFQQAAKPLHEEIISSVPVLTFRHSELAYFNEEQWGQRMPLASYLASLEPYWEEHILHLQELMQDFKK
jgi:hypothetical protein